MTAAALPSSGSTVTALSPDTMRSELLVLGSCVVNARHESLRRDTPTSGDHALHGGKRAATVCEQDRCICWLTAGCLAGEVV